MKITSIDVFSCEGGWRTLNFIKIETDEGITGYAECNCVRSWATLLGRVFRIDVTRCPDCGGRLRIIAALTDPTSIRTYLEGVGLPGVPPPRAPPQPQFEFAA